MKDQFCDWTEEDGEGCSNVAVVGVGPGNTPVCLDHFQAYLRQMRQAINRYLPLEPRPMDDMDPDEVRT